MILKKYIISGFILLSSSCSNQNTEIKPSSTEDSVKLEIVRKLISDFQRVSSLQIEDSVLRLENQKLKDKYFSAINYALNGKEFQIKSLYFQQKLEEIKDQKQTVELQRKELSLKYELSIRENEGYKYKLAEEYEKRNNALRDKAKLEQELSEASRLLVTGFTVNGVGSSINLLGKTKEFNTTQASKIKKIKIYFSLPTNQFAKKEEKKISVIMKSTDKKDDIQKDTTINYVGNECQIPVTLLSNKEFKEGEHNVIIIINNKLQTEKTFKITK